jgi:cysteinyl-tRNA synthetase
MVLNSGYRNPLTFNDEVIGQAKKGLERLRSALKSAAGSASGLDAATKEQLNQQVEQTQSSFIQSMDDDFNSAGALGVLFELVRVINQARDSSASDAELKPGQEMIRSLCGVLGLQLQETETKGHDADAFIDLLLKLRTELRGQKLYEMGDSIRIRLADLNVVIEDTREGSTWHWQS